MRISPIILMSIAISVALNLYMGTAHAAFPESNHPYTNNFDYTWTYTTEGNPDGIAVTFDAQTKVEAGYDFIYVMDADENQIPNSPFTGASLAGMTVTVPGDTVKIRLVTDYSITDWGFRVGNIVAAEITALFDAMPTFGLEPLEVTFIDRSVGGSNAVESWLWDFGDGSSSTEKNPVHLYQQAGVYTVSLTVTNSAQQDTITIADFITVGNQEGVADQFIWPIDEQNFFIFQGFGNLRMEVPGRYHAGTDFGVYRFDVHVRNIGNGWVENFNRWSGNGITIKHILPSQEVVYTWYYHLANDPAQQFEIGQFVPIGTVLGIVGETGWSPSGLHVHLEIKKVPDMNDGYLYDLSNHYNAYEFIYSRLIYDPDPPDQCVDGTPVDSCSAIRPFCCIEGGYLVENALKCGCDFGVPQADGTCSKTEDGIIIDNDDSGFQYSGNWTWTTLIMGHYGANYLEAPAGSLDSTASWIPNIPASGYYDVYGWWRGPVTSNPNTRATAAPVYINHAGETDVIIVDFSDFYKEWKFLGNFYFQQGNSNSVVVSGSQQGAVIADAFRFVPIAGGTPIANFTGTPRTGQAPLTVQFTDASTGGATSWSWNFGDGSTSTAQHPAHDYLYPGVYTVTLTVSGSGGSHSETKQNFIVVAEQGGFDHVVDNDSSGFSMIGTWYTSTLVSGYYGSNYRWAYDGNGSTRATWTFQVPSAGYYEVLAWWPGAYSTRSPNAPYTVNHAAGPTTILANQTVNGGQWNSLGTFYFAAGATQVMLSNNATNIPVADAVRFVSSAGASLNADFTGTPRTGQAPLTVQFTDASTGDVTSWSWNFGDGNTSTSQNPVHQYQNGGTYTVTLTVSGSGGSDSETKAGYVSVSAAPVAPVADFTGTPRTGQAPLTVEFTDASTGDVTAWLWDFGDGNTSTDRNPVHFYLNEGEYTVTLSVSGPAGSDSENKANFVSVSVGGVFDQVVDNNTPGFSVIAGSWFASTLVAGYYGTNYLWANATGAGGAPASVQWLFQIPSEGSYKVFAWWSAPYSTRSADVPYTINYSGKSATVLADQRTNGSQWVELGTYHFLAGDVSVMMSNSASAGAPVADAVRVVRVDSPVADFGATPRLGEAPLRVVFENLTYGNADSYFWDFGDGNNSTEENPTHNYLSPGVYTVTLEAIGAGGATWETKENFVVVTQQGGFDLVVDNDSSGFSMNGTWYASTLVPGYYGSNYRWAYAGNGSTRAIWTFQLPTDGYYQVLAWWPGAYSSRSPDAPYTINHADGSDTILVDQRVNGGQWNSLGTFYFAAGATQVILSNNATNIPVADAVRLRFIEE